MVASLHYISSTILGGPRFQEGTRSAKDKLERHSQERSARNGTHLGRGGGGSSQQTRMASECGPIRSRGRGMNQVQSSQVVVVVLVVVIIFSITSSSSSIAFMDSESCL